MDRDALERIAAEVRTCTRCALHEARTHAVPGEGAGVAGAPQQTLDEADPDRGGGGPADPSTPQAAFSGVMCVGEAPGRNEDETGRPFCGAAGKHLDAGLEAAALDRQEIFITSINKCRPPGNRDPKRDEKAACLPFLERQIEALRPKVLVALGRHGLSGLVEDPPRRFTDVRGTFLEGRHGVPVWVSLHPAAIIYRQAWRDAYLDDWRRLGEWVRTGTLPEPATPDA